MFYFKAYLNHMLFNRMKAIRGIMIGSKCVCANSGSPVEMLFTQIFVQITICYSHLLCMNNAVRIITIRVGIYTNKYTDVHTRQYQKPVILYKCLFEPFQLSVVCQ